jgi:hypothetical protein
MLPTPASTTVVAPLRCGWSGKRSPGARGGGGAGGLRGILAQGTPRQAADHEGLPEGTTRLAMLKKEEADIAIALHGPVAIATVPASSRAICCPITPNHKGGPCSRGTQCSPPSLMRSSEFLGWGLLTQQTSPAKITQFRQDCAPHASPSSCVTAKGDPLMKCTRIDLSSKHLTIPHLPVRSWFLVRPQLLTRV